MKTRLVFFNILLLGFFIPFIGGGELAKLGYFFLLASIVLAIPFFGKAARRALFNKSTAYLGLFLFFYLLTSELDALGCAAFFGRICPPIFFTILLGVLSFRPNLIKTQQFFVIIWIAVICYFEVRSLKFIAENPQGLRELVSIKKDATLFIGGGFSLPYGLAILIPGLFLFCMNGLMFKRKIIALGLCVFFSVLVFSALYMTAIILLLFGIGLAMIHGYPFRKKILLIVIFSFAAIFSYEFIPYLIEEFSPEGTMVLMRRFREIDSVLAGNDLSMSRDFYNRLLLSLESIKTFIENPFIGIGWRYNYHFFELEQAGVGSHAQWFDIFASYGMFALLLIGYLKNAATKIISKDNISIVLFVILGFLNPCLQFTIVFVSYCLVPMIKILFIDKSIKLYVESK